MAEKVHANHGRDHQHGASDPTLVAYEDVGDAGSGEAVLAVFVNRVTTVQSIPTSTVTFVSFDSVYYDYGDWVDLGVSATNLNVPEDGLYTVTGYVRWAGTTGGTRRLVAIQQNVSSGPVPSGTIAAQESPNVSSVGPDMSVTYTGELDAGHVLGLKVYQESGGSLNLVFGSLSAVRVQVLPP